jgi:hypothetical protein
MFWLVVRSIRELEHRLIRAENMQRQAALLMRSMLADMRRREDDLQRDRDHWRTAFENTQRLLPAPPPQDAPPTQPTQPDQNPGAPPPLQPSASRLRRSWRWLRSTG